MKKLLTILVLFSLIGFKATTVNADDLSTVSKPSLIGPDITILKSDIDVVKSDLAMLKSDLENLTKTVDELKGSINNLTPLTKTIEGLKCSIVCVSKDCSDIKKTINNVQMRVLRLLR